jgi:hypothetical protein
MPYIGTSPSNSVRRVHTYTATASQTTFTGASSEGVTLSYVDTNYIDVFQNGVLLGSADYTSTSGTSVVLAQGASADDLIVIVVYDVFSVADTVSKTNGGSFDSAVTMSNNLTVSGAFTSQGIDDNADANAITIDSSENVTLSGGLSMTSDDPTITMTDSSGTNDIGTIQATSGALIFTARDGSSDGEIIFKKFDGTTTDESMRIDNTGAITKPLQPAFSASLSSIQTNPANASRVAFNNEIFDQNADYNPSIYLFTAPVTGKYFLSFSIRIDAPDSAADYIRFNLNTSNRGYNSSIFDLGNLSGDPLYWNMQTAVLADMDANDTAEVEFIFAGGAQQTDISTESFFTGYLVC